MLACLPVTDPSYQLLSHTQMNTGLQKWDTTQKMRSAHYPTPAELDAYAKKVANNPLTIKIFPNSVKVPQRKHIRRTVNGLDTSSQRYSPYPSQVSTRTGLLAIVKVPVKGILKDLDGSRSRFLPKIIMNPHGGPYVTPSTLSLSQTVPHIQALSQPQPMAQNSLSHPPQNLPHPQAMQQQKSLSHPPSLQQQSLSRQQTLQQSLAHQQQTVPHQNLNHQQTLMQQQQQQQRQAGPQGLRHIPDLAPPGSLQHTQGFPHNQPITQAPGAGPPAPNMMLQQQPLPGMQVPRKLPDADAPPNVTVSTSTIPLSMAASLHQTRPGDLSSIVHQINQFCQARAGMGTTSVCEGQIANPSPISRNLLINASSRVCTQNLAANPLPSCSVSSSDKPGPPPANALPLPNMAAANRMPIYHNDMKQQQQPQASLPQQPQQRSWNQHQLAHLQQQLPEGAHPGKNLSRETTGGPGFPIKGMSYPPQEVCMGQPFNLKPPTDKPTPSPPVNGMPGAMSYSNGHYIQPPWNNILPTPNSDSSGSQDLAMPFPGGLSGTSIDCTTGVQYRTASAATGQTNLMQTMDYMGGEFQAPCLREQNPGMMVKMHRPPASRAQDSGDARHIHIHHPGYR
ncbi:protein FAM222B isoform X1 [Chanos chanos]|uniref:Protein FAM222B isoform X1 n=1 Tax=Chanos chanos TaxID=29144 RepID=A0A6J2VIA8_CHACN|nr:protein FAM222B isoform X1 [Chanos chanos]